LVDPTTSSAAPGTVYSPHLRTALVFTGTGTAGAYHAGVLRALHEAGVKVDIVAGRGVGVVAAMFAAVDGGARLWDSQGLWRSRKVRRLYGARGTLRLAAWSLAAALGVLLLPLGVLVLGLAVYPVAFVIRTAGLDAGAALVGAYRELLDLAFQPAGLPILLPRLMFLALVVLLATLVGGAVASAIRQGPRRRARGPLWWQLFGAPLNASRAADWFTKGLWQLMRGAAPIPTPAAEDLGTRYAELLADNLGQPGFRELIMTVHDIDARRDLVFALLGEPHRRSFFSSHDSAPRSEHSAVSTRHPAPSTPHPAPSTQDPGPRTQHPAPSTRHAAPIKTRMVSARGHRSLDTLDLGGAARRHTLDPLIAALCLPVATAPHLMTFAPEASWRGETHRLCDRTDAIGRLLEEVANAGAEQLIMVAGVPAAHGPHMLLAGRRDARGQVGEYLAASETSSVEDAITVRAGLFQAVFRIRPAHNPLGPLDFAGSYDEQSDRVQAVSELVDRGYEDGYRQFVDPVVGASGERLAPATR
jgi:hypothetical protein